jgi:hypothetical protein
LARVGRTVARIAVLAVFVGIAWSGLRWLSAPGEDELRGPCGSGSGIRCGICELVGRSDCSARPLTGCPATAVDYVASFPKFADSLKEQKKSVVAWTSFRKEMEQVQNRSSTELCSAQLGRMKKVEAEIPLPDACPGSGEAGSASDASARSEEISRLIIFRDCSEAKAKELGAEAKKRAAARVGETSQLHSMIKDVTKITTDSIELLTEFRAQGKEGQQTKCWLRGRIRDCAR